MPKLINLLNKNKMTLMAALPQNNLELAEAAVAGGADALQLQINVNELEDLEQEKEKLELILSKSKMPVGILLGNQKMVEEEEMREISKMGFDYLNVDVDLIPPFIFKLRGISKILALNSKFSIDKLSGFSSQGADALDAAIVPAPGWGKDLVVGDLQNYISIVLSAGIPVIIPTQRNIRTSEVAIVSDTGAKGILLTSVIVGEMAKDIEKAVKEYRIAVDDLGE